jgi:hypothetical protein
VNVGRWTIGYLAVLVGVIGGLTGAPARITAAQSSASPAQCSTNATPTDQQSTGQSDLVTLPEGTVISVRLADTVNSNRNHIGDHFSGMVDPSVIIENQVVIPRGTEAHVVMVDGKKGGRVHGRAELELALTSLVINGTKLEVESSTYGKSKGVLASKAAPEAKASANAAGDVALGGQPGVADPVIAAFRSAKAEQPAGSRIEFTLTAPFTFEKAPAGSNP